MYCRPHGVKHKGMEAGFRNVLQLHTNTDSRGVGVHFLSSSLKRIHSSSGTLKLRLLFIEIKLALK